MRILVQPLLVGDQVLLDYRPWHGKARTELAIDCLLLPVAVAVLCQHTYGSSL